MEMFSSRTCPPQMRVDRVPVDRVRVDVRVERDGLVGRVDVVDLVDDLQGRREVRDGPVGQPHHAGGVVLVPEEHQLVLHEGGVAVAVAVELPGSRRVPPSVTVDSVMWCVPGFCRNSTELMAAYSVGAS